MRLLYLLLACFLLFTACKKPQDDTTTVSGRVTNMHSGAPVANASVGVMQSKNSSGNASFSLKEEHYADSEGNFSFSFDGDEDYSYMLLAATPLGYYTPFQNGAYITPGRKNKDINVPAIAPAWVKIRIINEPPKDWAKIEVSGFGPVQQTLFQPEDTIIIENTPGSQNKLINWRITDMHGNEVTNSKDIFFPALDTVLLEIKY